MCGTINLLDEVVTIMLERDISCIQNKAIDLGHIVGADVLLVAGMKQTYPPQSSRRPYAKLA